MTSNPNHEAQIMQSPSEDKKKDKYNIARQIFRSTEPLQDPIKFTPPSDFNSPLPNFSFASSTKGCLAKFLLLIYEIAPKIGPHVKILILDDELDGPEDDGGSFVLDMLYCQKWDYLSSDEHPRVTDQSGNAIHPFHAQLTKLRLQGIGDTKSSIALHFQHDTEAYFNMIADMLSICTNLEYLFLPRTWVEKFPCWKFPDAKVLLTEIIDDGGVHSVLPVFDVRVWRMICMQDLKVE